MAAQRLNPKQLKELKDTFSHFDGDKSGTISIIELKNVCTKLGIRINDNDLKTLMKLMDKDGSGAIDFNEFANVMAEQFYRQPSHSELEAAFNFFDKDNSGYITEEELFLAMSKYRGNTTKEEIHKMVNAVDKDRDGKINKNEFISIILGKK